MTKRLFRHEHPVLLGLLILGAISILFLGGITFFISIISPSDQKDFFGKKNGIGIIEVKGVIISSEDLLQDLRDFRENQAVKAIVLRLDSPGGAVGASQELFKEVQRTKATKPVIASMGSVAASGAYYAALGANKIMASPGTITGSIGVILKFANLEELFGKIGYKSEVVKSGKLKDTGAPDRPLAPEERAVLQNIIDNVHQQFIRDVAASRGLPEEKVKILADGRIYSGEQAKNLGLIDLFGNFEDAITLAANLAGLDAKQPQLIYPKEKGFSLISLITGEQASAFKDRLLSHTPALSYEWALGQ
ncbi:MAG: signal peptidase [Deltaproteobacteria bacterium RIFOXYD12_FULL_50_9]|nr:MAG: signal peptidase [Deltaproteobacteria bacterium RIFOXYD12_FULL_50_9]